MLGKNKNCEECEEITKQKLITVYDYSIETILMGMNGEQITILATEINQRNKEEAAISGANHIHSDRSDFLKNGQSEFLSTHYYTISKITVTEIDSRQVLVDV